MVFRVRSTVSRCLGTAFLILGSTVGGQTVAGQADTEDEDRHESFAIEWVQGPVLRPTGVDDPEWAVDVVDVELLPDGRIVLVEVLDAQRLVVVSPDSGFARSVGRPGQGPGEYEWIRFARSHRGRLYVFDTRNMRLTVLALPKFEVLETTQLLDVIPSSLKFDGVVLSDSAYVLNAEIYSPERIGYALHLFQGDGQILNSFDEVPFGVPDAPPLMRFLAPSASGDRVWAAWRGDAYRLDLWNPWTSTRLRSIVRDVEWFPPSKEPTSWEPNRPGPSGLNGITVDGDGRLWVVGRSAAADRWAGCFKPNPDRSHPGALAYVPIETCASFNYHVEVFDSETGQVLASDRIPPTLAADYAWWGTIRGGWLYAVERDAYQWPVVRLWRPTLRSSPGVPPARRQIQPRRP